MEKTIYRFLGLALFVLAAPDVRASTTSTTVPVDYTGALIGAGAQPANANLCMLKPGPTASGANTCANGVIYFDCSTASGQAAMSTALAAIAAGKQVFVEYNQDPESKGCTSIVYMLMLP